MDLTERVAIVTGAGRGIGRGIARRLAQAGAGVVVVDVDIQAARDVAAELTDAGHVAVAAQADVTDPPQVEQTVADAVERFGRLDILVNNAGLTGATLGTKPFLDIDLKAWRRVIEVNLTGAFLFSQAAGRVMAQRGYGRIILLGSINSFGAEVGGAHYVASKTGILGLMRAMAVELAPMGVLVNCIAPGPVVTERTAPLASDPAYQQSLQRIALKRPGAPDEIGDAAVFLASDRCAFITGQTLVIDGGYLAAL